MTSIKAENLRNKSPTMNGALQAFAALHENFKDDKRVVRSTFERNPCSFVVRNGADQRFLSVYEHEDDFCVCLVFGPASVWEVVKKKLAESFNIFPRDIERHRQTHSEGNDPSTVTLEFYDEYDIAPRVLKDDELELLLKVAGAVVDALWEMSPAVNE